jgi:metallo-beta-lactamase class B
MFARVAFFSALALMTAGATSPATLPKGPPASQLTAACEGKDGWNDPAPPVRVFGNTYYVGTCGITALLVASDAGHVLVDTGTREAAPLVAANIRALGFSLEDVKWIVTSHEHHDHVGGVAELKRLTGAQVAAVPLAKVALEQGKVEWRDPQAASAEPFPAVAVERVIRDGEHLILGPLDLTAHTTTGHTTNSTSWSWRSCEGAECRNVVYADSVTAVSSEGYKFSEHAVMVDAFARSLGKIAGLPCDILLTPHPGASGLFDRLAGKRPLVDPDACLHYAEAGQSALERRIKDEGGGR